MKVTLWMSMSVNGIIARKNFTEEFISWKSADLWLEYFKKAGNVVLGRKAYEVFATWPKKLLDKVRGVPKIVLTTDEDFKVLPGFYIANSPKEVVEMLKKKGVTEIVLTGGSKLNSSFAKAGLINEIVLNTEPVVIGEGIPLFDRQLFDLKLKLLSTKQTKSNTLELHYKVI